MKLVQRIIEKINQKAVIKQTMKELNALSDRELNDLGICRADICSIANGQFAKDETLARNV